MGGIQSVSALPGDPTFNPTGNNYDVASYKRICAEFGIAPTSDFEVYKRKNHGLGNVYIGVTGHGAMKTGTAYPGGYYKFSDEVGKAKDGNLVYFIEPDDVAQYDWFAPKKTAGLTKAGLAHINESIEAFAYCILGAQVNVRSSIIGEGGRAKEAQTEFLTLMESAISQPDLAKSVQRYQLAVDEAKARLNPAMAPMVWLMPANMIINTANVVGYNNKLKQGVSRTTLGVNNELNTDKKIGAEKHGRGALKNKPPKQPPFKPGSQSCNLCSRPEAIQKTAKRVRFNLPSDEVCQIKETFQETQQKETDKTDNHEINKPAVIVGVVAVATLLILASR